MKVCVVLNLVLCVLAGFVNALSSEEELEIKEACCAHGEAVDVDSASSCAAVEPPEYIEPDQTIVCSTAITSCCEKQYKSKLACEAGMKLAEAKKCNSPDSDIGQTCCTECSYGRWMGEASGKAGCGSAPGDDYSPDTKLKKIAYYQCCLEAAENLEKTTTTKKPEVTTPVPTTTEAPTTTEEATTTERPSCKDSSCEHLCDDDGGVVRCSCRQGYRLQADKTSCVDINECAEAIDDLCTVENTVCHNTPGSFKCVPLGTPPPKRDVGSSCPPGYKMNVVNQVCDDINECQLSRPPCPKYLCENTIGAYKCAGKPGKPYADVLPGAPTTEAAVTNSDAPRSDICPPGFRAGQDDECLDIDECTEHLDDCQRLSQHCINSHGSFFCQDHVSKRCAPGFKVNARSGICEDIDECEESSEVCKRTETCVNLPGAYNCKSKISTLPKLATKTCQEGTRLRPGGTICEDIDECREGSHLCDQFQNCINTFGAHECRCKNGFELDSSTGSCVDIDECALKLDNCNPEQHCLNLLGSFTCARNKPTTTSTTPQPYEYEYYDSYEDNYDESEPGPLPPPVLTTTERPTTNTRKPTTTTRKTTTSTTTSTTTPRPTKPTTTSTAKPRTNKPNRPAPTDPSNPEYPPSYPGGSNRPDYPTRPGQPDYPSSPDYGRPNDPRPDYSRPGEPRPDYGRPGESRPDYGRPGESRPDYSRPNEPRPDYGRPGVSRPDYGRPGDSRPDYERPDESRPDYGRPGETRRDFGRPGEPRPDYARPGESRPDYGRPVEPRPDYARPGESRPDYSRPGESRPNYGRPGDARPDYGRPADPTTVSRPGYPNRSPSPAYDNNPGGDYNRRPNTTASRPTYPTTTPQPREEDRRTNEVGDTLDPDEVHCFEGYVKDAEGNCIEENICDTDRHTCKNQEVCIKKPGGYDCECMSGFQRDPSGWCSPIPTKPTTVITTSSTTTAAPPTSAVTPASWYGVYPTRRQPPQSCDVGYTYDNRQGKCVDIDECATNKASCSPNEQCVNIDGGYRCMRTNIPTYTVPSSTPRAPSAEGRNVITVGSQYGQRGPYSPRPTYTRVPDVGAVIASCPWGYKLTPDKRCYDIDECARNSSECGPQQRCENFYGGYSCQCPTGHRLVGQNQCEDINECMHGNPCAFNAECVNTLGSYKCSCREGFRSAPSNDKVCEDVDECSDTPGVCHQLCSNTWGHYRCYCKRGYRLGDDNKTCVDIDECALYARGKLCAGDCVNSPGSYRCACPSGYRMAEDARSCIDIDECEAGTASCNGDGAVCQNTRGSYHCHHIRCPPGYKLEAQHRCTRIQRSCQVGDWNCLQQPSTYSYNFITFVANIYLPAGSVDLFTMHGPAWRDSVVSFEMRMIDVQAGPSVRPADLRCFDMRPSNNICVISLLCSLQGPQVVELELSMSLYQRSMFAGSAVARLVVIVSQYEY